MSAPRSSELQISRYVIIAIAVATLAILALVAPTVILGIAVLAGPIVFLELVTDLDHRELDGTFRSAFGPETRALPII